MVDSLKNAKVTLQIKLEDCNNREKIYHQERTDLEKEVDRLRKSETANLELMKKIKNDRRSMEEQSSELIHKVNELNRKLDSKDCKIENLKMKLENLELERAEANKESKKWEKKFVNELMREEERKKGEGAVMNDLRERCKWLEEVVQKKQKKQEILLNQMISVRAVACDADKLRSSLGEVTRIGLKIDRSVLPFSSKTPDFHLLIICYKIPLRHNILLLLLLLLCQLSVDKNS